MSAPFPLPESRPKFRVAICGAGVSGLTLALTIGKYDHSIPIDLYEAHDSIETDDIGIIVWPQTHQIMMDLELLADFRRISENKSPSSGGGVHLRRGDIREGGYHWFHKPHSGPSSMHCRDMMAILEKHLPASCTVHVKKQLSKYVERKQQDAHLASSILLEFADGTTATTDILIGADGVRSAVRGSMFQMASEDNGGDKTDLKQYIDAIFTGMVVYRYLLPTETLKKEDPTNISLKQFTSYVGKGRYLVTCPIAKGTLISVAASINDRSLIGKHYEGHWISNVTRDEVLGSFDDFEPDARTVVKLCEKPSKLAMHVVKPLPFCVQKRVALIGDACHAMTPYLGAGGSQAMDDAYVLGRLIAHPLTSLSRVEEALRIYEEICLPFAQAVASLSISNGWMCSFMAPEYYDGTRKEEGLDDRGVGAYEREGMEAIKQEVYRQWDFIDGSRGALQAWLNAESKLQALAG